MTGRTVVTVLTGLMIWGHYLRKIFPVAAVAIGRETFIDFIHVAFSAVRLDVCTGKLVIRLSVIECRGFPQRSGMTCQTIMRELSFVVIGCDQFGNVLQMTREALFGCSFKRSGGMTFGTFRSGVCTDELKFGLRMIER